MLDFLKKLLSFTGRTDSAGATDGEEPKSATDTLMTRIYEIEAGGDIDGAIEASVQAQAQGESPEVFLDKRINLLVRQKEYEKAWALTLELYATHPGVEIRRKRTNNLLTFILNETLAKGHPTATQEAAAICRELLGILTKRGLETCLVLGNCQSPGFTILLNESGAFRKKCYAYTFKAVHALTSVQLDFVHAVTGDFSRIITQRLFAEHFGPIRTENLLAAYGERVMTIPTCWFDAYFPDCLALNIPTINESFAFHSKYLFSAFFQGRSVEDAVRSYEHGDFLTANRLDASLERNRKELESRDKNLDVSITDYIFANFRDKQLFYSPNHPAIDVLVALCNGIIAKLGLEPDLAVEGLARYDNLKDPLWHIHKKVATHYGLRFYTKDAFTIGGRDYSIREYADMMFDFLGRLPEERRKQVGETGMAKIHSLEGCSQA
jgi:hypothetical protein